MSNTGKFGLLACISLIMGNMIGSGIFLLPSALAQFGSISLVGWVVSTGGALLLAFVFSSLSEAHPTTGGPYAYTRAMLGDFAGFQVGLCYWLAAMFSISAMMVAFSSYLSAFLPILKTHKLYAYGVSMTLLWTIAAINLNGIKPMKIFQTTTTVCKILPLLLVVGFGLFHMNFDNFKDFNVSEQSNVSAIALSAILTMWALMGLESATVPAEHVDNPRRTIPLATYIGTALAACVYILCSAVILGLIPVTELQASNSPFIDAGHVLFGHWGAVFIGVIALISSGSCAIGWVLIQAEVPLACANDNLFPKFFARKNSNNIPSTAMIISTIIVSLIMLMMLSDKLLANFTRLVEYSALGYLLSILYTSVAGLITFIRQEERSAKHFLKILIGLIASSYMLWMIAGSKPDEIYFIFVLLLLTGPLYALVQWWNR